GEPWGRGAVGDRRVSRFNRGRVAGIVSPGLEGELGIIKIKVRLSGVTYPENVMMEVAERVKANARELEGALNRLQGMAKAEGRPIDMAMAKACLGDQPGPVKAIRMQDIMGMVTSRFDVRVSDVQGRKRSRSIA